MERRRPTIKDSTENLRSEGRKRKSEQECHESCIRRHTEPLPLIPRSPIETPEGKELRPYFDSARFPRPSASQGSQNEAFVAAETDATEV